MADRETLQLVCDLAERESRADAAQRLAVALGAQHLLLFILDRRLGVFLPATGMPQTRPGGPGWSSLLRSCHVAGEHRGEVCYPDREHTLPALALSTQAGLVLVLVGGEPRIDTVPPGLPLLAAVLRAESDSAASEGVAAAARSEVHKASALATVLDATRADLERSLSETRRLNAELQNEAQRKDEFLAMLAHELRNPLSPILSALGILREQPLEDSTRRLLSVMHRQARHLTRLVDDLLDVSRISRGRVELRLEAVDVAAALLQAVDSARPLIDRERHTLTVSLPEHPLYVRADAVRLAQVFTNLLTNAAKYTDQGGHIEARVTLEEGSVAVRVRDDGIGIEPEMISRVFELFAQAPRALDRSKGGLGIGLTLVQRLLALHGGTIEAESAGAGQGSQFTIRLPPCAPPEAAAAPAQPAWSRRSRRILVVDDNADAADLLAETLRVAGYDVRIAADGAEGIETGLSFEPDVALLDIGLPGIDGYGVARELRPRLPRAQIVALSGYGGAEYRRQATDAGFDHYLVKPVEIDELLNLLSRTGTD